MSKDFHSIGVANEEKQSRDTPEHRLWIAVLKSFLEEAKYMRGTPRARGLFLQAKGEWYRFICDLIDIDHGVFIRHVKDILGIG